MTNLCNLDNFVQKIDQRLAVFLLDEIKTKATLEYLIHSSSGKSGYDTCKCHLFNLRDIVVRKMKVKYRVLVSSFPNWSLIVNYYSLLFDV